MPRDYDFWIYIVTNRNHSVLYIGVTNRLSRRVWEHREGIGLLLSKLKRTVILHIALQDATGNKPGLACNSLMNELHQCLVFERFCKEAESSRIECGLAH